MRPFIGLVIILFALMGCKEDPNAPYLEFAGGGFIFNYRNAEAFYGFVAKPLRSLPEGSVIEAQFEVPNSSTPYVVTEAVKPGVLQFMFRTSDLRGIEKGHPYKAVMRLLASPSGPEIARYERTFHTDVEQASLPDKPLVVGPGYQPNPNP
ncbi:MAG: hypothetical protein U1E67_12360 [Hyphomicrobiales bacterium]